MKVHQKFTLHKVNNHFTSEKLQTTAKMYGMPTINNNGLVIVQLGKIIKRKQKCGKILERLTLQMSFENLINRY